MTGYYDYVLGFIPLALLGVSGVLTTAGFATTTAVALGASVAFVGVAHALFVNGPVDDTVAVPTTQSPPSPPSRNPVNAD
jgi:hypothetical protein